MVNVEDLGDYFRVPMDSRTLNYCECNKDKLNKEIEICEYNSSNTKRLNLKETKENKNTDKIILYYNIGLYIL